MSKGHLDVYLRDHRAGAEAAVDLLNHLERVHAGTALAAFAEELRLEIEMDLRELEGLMKRAGIDPSMLRDTAAWLAGKIAQLKVRADDLGDGALRLLESLETLALGIDGKRALWLALAATDHAPAQRVDYARLIRRADGQRQAVEVQRIAAAKRALG